MPDPLDKKVEDLPAPPLPDTNRNVDVKILIVDDEEAVTKSLSRYLMLEGYDVDVANNPFVALQKVSHENFLIVISDIAMPGMNGVELLRRIKKYNGMVQVIMITGYVTLDNILTCLRIGADDCFIKPIVDLDKLKHAIDEAINKLNKWHNLMVEITQGR
jgi:DNA-binding NtrC family response regulator